MKSSLICQCSKVVGRSLLGLLAGALVFAFGAISLGAPVGSKYMLSTTYWSLLMSLLTFTPAAAIFGASWVDWQRIFIKTSQQDLLNIWFAFQRMAVIGSWFGAWPMPLDWERPWQEWPICVTYGALIGYVLGVVASFVLYFHSRRRPSVKVD